jgi:hypothetical protein
MTLQELKDKYAGIIHRQSAAELKGNPVFMKACRENEEFRAYVLDRKPTMATVRLTEVKFKHTEVTLPPEPVKPAHVDPEPIEELSRTGEIVRDLKAYREKKGFL